MASYPIDKQIEDYIRVAARERGIDPDIAVAVARSEGLNNSASPADGWRSGYVRNGYREPSYGPFQLLEGGPGTGFPKGMGNDFKKETGKSASSPDTVFSQVDYALDGAARSGWSPWYGAAKAGISKRQGLDGAQPRGLSANRLPSPQTRPRSSPATLVSNTQPPAASRNSLPDDVQPLSYSVNTNMNPLLSSRTGASRLTRTNAPNVAQGVLSGPYQRMQDNYRLRTGKDLPPINDMLAKRGTSRERNTPNSKHFSGKAIDFGIGGSAPQLDNFERKALLESAMAGGFKGIGMGGNILHVDTRKTPGAWNYQNPTYAGQPVGKLDRDISQGRVPQSMMVTEMRGAPIPGTRPASPRGQQAIKDAIAQVQSPQPQQNPFNQVLGTTSAQAATLSQAPQAALTAPSGPQSYNPLSRNAMTQNAAYTAPQTQPSGIAAPNQRLQSLPGQPQTQPLSDNALNTGIQSINSTPMLRIPTAPPMMQKPAPAPALSPMTAPMPQPSLPPMMRAPTPAPMTAPTPPPMAVPVMAAPAMPKPAQRQAQNNIPTRAPFSPLQRMKIFGNQNKGAIGGALIGGAIGGLPGAVIGGMLGNRFQPQVAPAQPTGNINQFPDAPQSPIGGGSSTGFNSTAQRDRARSMSARTADAISRGQGGLF